MRPMACPMIILCDICVWATWVKKDWKFWASEDYLEIIRRNLFSFVSTVSMGSNIEQNSQRLSTLQKVILNHTSILTVRGLWEFHHWEARYFFSTINDCSRMTSEFIMKQKSEAFKCFKHWTILMENQIGKVVKCLRIGNDLEFCSTELNEIYKDEGIARQRTICYSPQ